MLRFPFSPLRRCARLIAMVVSSDMTLERREARRKMRTPDAMQNPDRRVPWTFEKPATHVRENAGALPFSTCAHLKFSHRNPRVLLHTEAGGGAPQNKKRPGKKSKEETMDEKQRRHAYTHTHTPTQSCRHLRNPVQDALTAAISGSLGRQPRTGIRSIVHTVPIWRRSTRRTARANVSANKTLTVLNQSWLGQKGVPRS
ncbi:hypothetical protein BDP67DRAFT_252506 [Colletotrichum lupini]|nr:hypothetical protein BDP67DRAFT_252506 [Colletotrichum lupini]